ncbi:unnamed protein product [Lactuca virosa]|uniref:Uncharacterized protein n=1 Tax=Lactuca virosa TaxID=75947 RepID=A0AAU9NFD8_9ASTR|nr:unnamed protein product [Lactuca virosa]
MQCEYYIMELRTIGILYGSCRFTRLEILKHLNIRYSKGLQLMSDKLARSTGFNDVVGYIFRKNSRVEKR